MSSAKQAGRNGRYKWMYGGWGDRTGQPRATREEEIGYVRASERESQREVERHFMQSSGKEEDFEGAPEERGERGQKVGKV